MSPEKAKYCAKVMQAFAEGKPIQWQYADTLVPDQWNDNGIPDDWREFNFRIKPEVQPFTSMRDFIFNLCYNTPAIYKDFCIKNKSNVVYNISSIKADKTVDVFEDSPRGFKITLSFKDLAEDYLFMNGTPCNVKI